MSKAEFVVGSLGGAILILIFIWIAVALYLAYTKMDVMLEHLKNSSAVKALAFYRQLGVWGHLKLIGEIAALITSPDKCIKSGRLSAQDIENFPAPLKKKLILLRWSVLVLVSLLFLVAGIGKVAGWI
ncbi:hypothetical protein [Pseudomonas sp. NPDC087626]|uniref:hypothetical protein n=1 Tax=Pseudomonas sp. NPDC087626 TaxID=3364444 RepID=UPI00381EAA29